MPRRVSDLHRRAFVTGASTGLGRAFAEMLLADGVQVWGTSRDPARLSALVASHPGQFFATALELRDGPGAAAAFRAADQASGGFDLIINNAGFGVFAEFAGIDFETWNDQLQVMLVNTARLSHVALPGLLARSAAGHSGALVNVASLAVNFPLPFQSAYNVAKSGLAALSESLMVEVEGTNVVVIDLRPGDYRTDFEGSVLRPQPKPPPRLRRAWAAFERLMRSGPAPRGAAAALRQALLRHRSGTVHTGRFFQAVLAPFLARFGTQGLKRRLQAGYFDLS